MTTPIFSIENARDNRGNYDRDNFTNNKDTGNSIVIHNGRYGSTNVYSQQ